MIVMAYGRSLTEPVELWEPERFDDLHVEQPADALFSAGVVVEAQNIGFVAEDGRIALRVDWLASCLAKLEVVDAEWKLREMVDYAESKGWAGKPAGTVTAHVQLI